MERNQNVFFLHKWNLYTIFFVAEEEEEGTYVLKIRGGERDDKSAVINCSKLQLISHPLIQQIMRHFIILNITIYNFDK